MISVREGQERILAHITEATAPEIVSAPKALGRVLAEILTAPFDVPPTDNSAVDGYAVSSADIPGQGTRDLVVVADLPAGSVYDGVLRSGEALRIMTGAPMPAGAHRLSSGGHRRGANVRVGPTTRRTYGCEATENGEIVIEAAACCPEGDRRDHLARIWQVVSAAGVAMLSRATRSGHGAARRASTLKPVHAAERPRQCGADVVDSLGATRPSAAMLQASAR